MSLVSQPDKGSGGLASIVHECVEGRLSPGMALMRLILETESPMEANAAVSDRTTAAAMDRLAAARLAALSGLLRRYTHVWQTVRSTAAAVPHDATPTGSANSKVGRIATSFDQAARVSPEASVALYSFGKPARLDAATREIVEWLDAREIIAAEREFLDIGCGIGRLEKALHDRVRRIVGVDISSEMVRIARERCADHGNVEVSLTSGTGLEQFFRNSFDCIIAVDTFPYLVSAGSDLAEHHIAGAARVLRPGGDLVILNFSYRGSLEHDRADLRELADLCGFRMVLGGERPFTRWDGSAFHLVRSG
jgi:ubiquinone/menaquinone biosynthesis C-methylase UbiE